MTAAAEVEALGNASADSAAAKLSVSKQWAAKELAAMTGDKKSDKVHTAAKAHASWEVFPVPHVDVKRSKVLANGEEKETLVTPAPKDTLHVEVAPQLPSEQPRRERSSDVSELPSKTLPSVIDRPVMRHDNADLQKHLENNVRNVG